MRRHSLLSMIVAIAAFVCILIGSTANAQAQLGCEKCTYAITMTCELKKSCIPFAVTSNWTGSSDLLKTDLVTTCGTTIYKQPQPCPPLWDIQWASIDGGRTVALPNGRPVKCTLPCGTTVCLQVTVDRSGCTHIYILPSC